VTKKPPTSPRPAGSIQAQPTALSLHQFRTCYLLHVKSELVCHALLCFFFTRYSPGNQPPPRRVKPALSALSSTSVFEKISREVQNR